MKFSYEWLQSYFENPLPPFGELTELLSVRVAEVEESSESEGWFDLSITPNRAHDCLGHFGLAYEIQAATGIALKQNLIPKLELSGNSFLLEIASGSPVERFSALKVVGLSNKATPQWLKARLEAVGQRSINVVVDITNYVMFEYGQPMHAYDAEKLKGGLGVRMAKADEKVQLLDGEEHVLGEDNAVIIDTECSVPLGVAGVKGGATCEITSGTKEIVFEAAHFTPTAIRKSARALKLHTDASKRFENEPSPEWCGHALARAAEILAEIEPGLEVTMSADYYPQTSKNPEVLVTLAEIESLLGVEIDLNATVRTLKLLGFKVENESDTLKVTAPFWRLDVSIKEDVIEDIARHLDLGAIPETPLPPAPKTLVSTDPSFVFTQRGGDILRDLGFSEVMTYSFQKKGEVEVLKAVARDKGALRKNLSKGLTEALALNERNAELFGSEHVRFYEVGRVFSKEAESWHLGIALGGKKESELLAEAENALTALNAEFKTTLSTQAALVEKTEFGIVVELTLTEALANLPAALDVYPPTEPHEWQRFSEYPYVLRDLAAWVPSDTTPDMMEKELTKVVGPLLVRCRLIDTFTHDDGRTSIAYRLVFQSQLETLTDQVVNQKVAEISTHLAGLGYTVR